MQSRRAALVTLASATASVAISPLLAQHQAHDGADALPLAPTHDPVFFDSPGFATVTRLADLIIPRTDTPGALDANVPFHIDQEVSTVAGLQPVFREGLATLAAEARKSGQKDFIALSEPQQMAILSAMSESPDTPGGRFFRAMKDLTIDCYYRSEEGLVKELGFHGNTFRPNFPGCNHPEHWPAPAAAQEQK